MKPKRIAAIEIRSKRAAEVAYRFAANFGLATEGDWQVRVGNTLINFAPTAADAKDAPEGISGLTLEVDNLEEVAARLRSLGCPSTAGEEPGGKRFILVGSELAHGVELKVRQA